MNNFKILTLVENTVVAGPSQLIGEHGLSFLIDTGEKKILFDTGQGMAIMVNTKSFGVDLSEIDNVILSHGHFDHGGGLKNILDLNNNFTLNAHPAVFDNKLAKARGNCYSIGIQDHRDILEKKGINISLEKNSVEITPGIITTGEIPMITDFERVEPMFFTEKNGQHLPDNIPDDKALILDTKKGTVVIFGCAHRGPVNTLMHVRDLIGNKKIHAIMGGLHLMLADERKLKKIFACFNDFGVEKMIVGHCTGFHALVALVNQFGAKVTQNAVGHVIEF